MGAEGYSVQTIALNPCHPGQSVVSNSIEGGSAFVPYSFTSMVPLPSLAMWTLSITRCALGPSEETDPQCQPQHIPARRALKLLRVAPGDAIFVRRCLL